MPEAYKQLREITTRLERHYKDVQDFEFTIQDNTLYMLQTRNGKRTGLAAVHIAVDMVRGGDPDHEAGGACSRSSRRRSTSSCTRSSTPRRGKARGRRQGPARLAGRGHGRGRVHRGRGGGLDAEGQARAAGAHGDGARRHPRHERGAGHAHRDRRHDLARGRRRPPDGQALRRGLRRARHRRQGPDAQGRRQDAQGRRPGLDRRLDRRGDADASCRRARPRCSRSSRGRLKPEQSLALPEVREAAGLGRRGPAARHPRQRRRPADAKVAFAFGAAASASAAPSTCSSPRTACRTS